MSTITRSIAKIEENDASQGLCSLACRIRNRSISVWNRNRVVEIVGRSPALESLLARLEKVATYREPVLLVGESGVGKESLAQALYLLGQRAGKPFVTVNCPQFQEGNLTVSELFGHKRGSFTGAASDRRGSFELADGGVIFLDEIADLHPSAQVMLLRTLASGELQPLGSEAARRIDVRVVAATNQSLNHLAGERQFRRDLLFRLRYFLLEVPPLRARGEDWRLLVDHVLDQLQDRYGVRKRLSAEALQLLERYSWPGNVRELIGVITASHALAEGTVIEAADLVDRLEPQLGRASDVVTELLESLEMGQGEFWQLVQEPYLDRELNRWQVQQLIARGLRLTGGSYRRLLERWRLTSEQYQKFMDFLRHHRLKPAGFNGHEA